MSIYAFFISTPNFFIKKKKNLSHDNFLLNRCGYTKHKDRSISSNTQNFLIINITTMIMLHIMHFFNILNNNNNIIF